MRSPRRVAGITEVTIAEVHVGPRLRDVNDAGVEGIRVSLEEGGVLLNPITVRKVAHRDGRLELVAGRHRLEAARLLGWETIPATVWDCGDDWAEMMELHENLGRRDLNALDRTVFMARTKALHERLHPHTKRGFAGAGARWSDATEFGSVASFAKATAEATGLTERQIFKVLAAGQHLAADEVAQLRAAPRAATLADLQALSKLADDALRKDVVRRLGDGTSRTAAKAIKAATGRDARDARDPADQAYEALRAAYERAPIAARRRFRSFLLREGDGS